MADPVNRTAQIGYGQNIVLIEYFVDADPGFGNATAVGGFSAGPEVANLKFSVHVASLIEGVHRLYLREKKRPFRHSQKRKWERLDRDWDRKSCCRKRCADNLYFKRPEPLASENFYRLKMVDYDQTYSMSRIISLRFNEALQTIFYPNPTSRQITVSAEKEITSYELISAGGQTLDSKSSIVAIREFVIPLDKFPAGPYVLRIVFQDGGVEVRKIVVR